MCTQPGYLDGVRIACRDCPQCKDRRINDWVGRALAEMRTTIEAGGSAYFVTLTYGHDPQNRIYEPGLRARHPHAFDLVYADPQKFMKRIRHATPGVRFFCVGEFGSLKGRAHWHILLFFPGAPLANIETHKKCFTHWVVTPEEGAKLGGRQANGVQSWPHGFSYWEELTEHRVRYVMKYVTKSMDFADNADEEGMYIDPETGEILDVLGKKMGLSCQPPLGDAYFRQYAKEYAEQGLAPQDLFYTVPGSLMKDGRHRKYMLKDRSARNFMDYYIEAWAEMHPDRRFPGSPLIERHEADYQDRQMLKALGKAQPVRIDDREIRAGKISEEARLYLRQHVAEMAEKNGRWHMAIASHGIFVPFADRQRLVVPGVDRDDEIIIDHGRRRRLSLRECRKRRDYRVQMLVQHLTAAIGKARAPPIEQMEGTT